MQKVTANERSVTTLAGQYRKFFYATIVAVLFLQVATVVDTIIVGRLLGSSPMSGIRVAMPVVNMLNVVSTLIGVGSAAVVSIALGRRKQDRANRGFTAGIVLTLIIGGVIACVVAPLSGTIAAAISTDSSLVQYAATYMGIVMAASPVYIMAAVLAILLRTDGAVRLSSVVLATGGGMNVLLDLLFMGALGMGVEGSAYATVLGMTLACAVGLLYFRWPHRSLKLCNVFKKAPRQQTDGVAAGVAASQPEPDSRDADNDGLLSLAATVFKNGAPASLRLLFVSVATMFMNYIVGAKIGALGIAILTVCANLQNITMGFFSAGGQVAMPLEGVLFGERDYVGLRLLVNYVFKVVLTLVAILVAIIWVFPNQIVGLFGIKDVPTDTAWLLRIYAIGLLPLTFNYIMTYYYNVIQHQKLALLITSCENLVLYLPLIWALTNSAGLLGSVLAFAIAEGLTICVMYLASRSVARRTNTSPFLLLPSEPDELVYDVSIKADEVGASGIARGVRQALESTGVEKVKANRAAVAAEEMVMNGAILKSNRKRTVYFDVRVFAQPDGVRITLRDNGAPFDPTQYSPDEQEEFATDGIAVLHALASGVAYRYTLGLNQTIVDLSR
ncbi:MAG: MATE family efflux transporter [Coriobacteriales bacterium]|nr:MATE family efflux transporter [Coriobacteriales bacterium]